MDSSVLWESTFARWSYQVGASPNLPDAFDDTSNPPRPEFPYEPHRHFSDTTLRNFPTDEPETNELG